jgi:hypothetical protein
MYDLIYTTIASIVLVWEKLVRERGAGSGERGAGSRDFIS